MSLRRINFVQDPQLSISSNQMNNYNYLNTELINSNSQKYRFKYLIKSPFFIASIIFNIILIIVLCIVIFINFKTDEIELKSLQVQDLKLPIEQSIWYDKGLEELKIGLNIKLNKRYAKNVILFIGDGMGPNTVTASRIYGFKEGGLMSWEKFPHMGMLKTYSFDKQVPDSFSTASALFGGVKVNYETGGLDSSIKLGNCTGSLDEKHHVKTIMKLAQDDNINTGFVTTTRVTHATPAALYAHMPDRRWECEAKIPDIDKLNGCKDIGRILIESKIGKNIKVIMGGGRQCLVSNVKGTSSDEIDTWACYSKDGRNLIRDWENEQISQKKSYAVLSNNSDLNHFDSSNTDYVLGIFANGHLNYDYKRDKGPSGMPSLKDMTIKALEVLNNKNKRFLLVVEGGMIDQAHHRGAARKALSETLALNDAVEGTIEYMKDKLDETLIIVTADHSHTLTINGYPERGNNILDIGSKSRTDNIPYTTLTYGTSNLGFQIEIDKKTGKLKRKDPSKEDTKSYDYIQQSAIETDENTHGGSDVTIHAIGPMAHLFHRIHENSYVAHVISYALRIGRFKI